MGPVYEHEEENPLADGETDGMADAVAEMESSGLEGEHVWDALVEDPPHPFWNPATGRCHDEPAADADGGSDKPMRDAVTGA